MKKIVTGNGALFRISHESGKSEIPTNVDTFDFKEDADDELLLKLSDQDLRRIFCGLVEAAQKRRCKAVSQNL